MHRNQSLPAEMQVSWEEKWRWFGWEGRVVMEMGGREYVQGRRIRS